MTGVAFVLAATVASSSVFTPADCPQIFGSEQRRARQRQMVQYAVDGVEQHRETLRVFHRMGKWQKPEAVSLAGLSVVSVDRAAQTALVELKKNEVCPTGPYRISHGDSIGAGGYVLGVTDRGLLFGDEKRIRFLRLPSVRPPQQFEMVWRSDYRVFGGGGAAAASSSSKTDKGPAPLRNKSNVAAPAAREAARGAREAAAKALAKKNSVKPRSTPRQKIK